MTSEAIMSIYSPAWAWGVYVGQQTPEQFMAGSDDPEEAVRDYTSAHPFFADLTIDEQTQVIRLLVAYIGR
tara:strand:- start:138 stop:350 length:213 start_codon:yes stop_codon:yes gene_type:complete